MTLSTGGLARAAAAAAAILALAAPAAAVWPFNMPSNARQQLGVGFGPGYHAPLVLATPCRAPLEARRVHYRLRAPQVGDGPAGACFGPDCSALAMPIDYHAAAYATPAQAHPPMTHPAPPTSSLRYAPLPATEPQPAQATPEAAPAPEPRKRAEPTPPATQSRKYLPSRRGEPASPSDEPSPETIPLPRR